jgi:hypothetical protein
MVVHPVNDRHLDVSVAKLLGGGDAPKPAPMITTPRRPFPQGGVIR